MEYFQIEYCSGRCSSNSTNNNNQQQIKQIWQFSDTENVEQTMRRSAMSHAVLIVDCLFLTRNFHQQLRDIVKLAYQIVFNHLAQNRRLRQPKKKNKTMQAIKHNRKKKISLWQQWDEWMNDTKIDVRIINWIAEDIVKVTLRMLYSPTTIKQTRNLHHFVLEMHKKKLLLCIQ